MFTEPLEQLASTFSRRFLFNALLPTLIFVSIIAAVYVGCLDAWRPVTRWWTSLDALSKLAVTLGYVSAIWFLATAMASQWRRIVRLYEGYPLMQAFRKVGWKVPGVAWHQKHLADLEEDSKTDRSTLYYEYPSSEQHLDRLMPTRLGNILLAGEAYSSDRYGVDCIIFWPRLSPLLPEEFQVEYEGFIINYEFPLVVSFQAGVATALTWGMMLWTHQLPVLYLLAVAGGFIVSYVAYLFSLESAVELAEQQRTAFDLYRDRLLEAWPTVADIKDEKEAFTSIVDFVLENDSLDWEAHQTAHHARRAAEEPEAGE